MAYNKKCSELEMFKAEDWPMRRSNAAKPQNETVDAAEASADLPKSDETKAKEDTDNKIRENRSRKMLASSGTTPDWIKERFPVPFDVTVSHVIHNSTTLPHFQMRFHNNESCDGKHQT